LKPPRRPAKPDWHTARGLMPRAQEPGPQGALVPDEQQEQDQIAVVYDRGNPPKITIRQVSGTVHTVLADGVAVAVIASASGPAPTAADVLLVERLR
jgi:hypothetical protein